MKPAAMQLKFLSVLSGGVSQQRRQRVTNVWRVKLLNTFVVIQSQIGMLGLRNWPLIVARQVR